MNKTASICVFLAACNFELVENNRDVGPYPTDNNEEYDSPVIEEMDVESDSPYLETDIDSDTITTETETDTVYDTDHPTMDSDGNPLYPTLPDENNDTGTTPDILPGEPGDVIDCNINDDFMLRAYVDMDQDGFGVAEAIYANYGISFADQKLTYPITSIFKVKTSICFNNNYSYYRNSKDRAGQDLWTNPYQNYFKTYDLFDTSKCYNGGITIDFSNLATPNLGGYLFNIQTKNNMSFLYDKYYDQIINDANTGTRYDFGLQNNANTQFLLFSDIFLKQTGEERFLSAIDIINKEGDFQYKLTKENVILYYRKEFMQQLHKISEKRCQLNSGCATNLFFYFDQNGIVKFLGFKKETYLVYLNISSDESFTMYDIGGTPTGSFYYRYRYIASSPLSASFFPGDANQTGFQLDLDANVNNGLFSCDWASYDNDGDGFSLEDGDCNDAARWINPLAKEIPSNNTDNNCDGYELCFIDKDADGFPGIETESVFGTQCEFEKPEDCNDNDQNIKPGVWDRACDGVDQNCNGSDYN